LRWLLAVAGLLLGSTVAVAACARGGVSDSDPVRVERVDSIVRGELALQPAAQRTATPTALAEPPGDEGPPASETPGPRKSDAVPTPRPDDPGAGTDVGSGAAPRRDAEGKRLLATQYPCWPTELWPAVARVEACESDSGRNPATYDLSREHGGPLQISRSTWEGYMLKVHGWTWEQVVTDPTIHYCAAWEVFERAGYTWSPWGCRP
jgi:hypothetical protein